MPRAKPPKNLAVDGTAKLAAKSKPDDKHEAPDLNIEEATVASPRPSRKRAGDFFDFGNGADAESSSKPAEPKTAKPKKAAKTGPADKDEESHEIAQTPAATVKSGRKGRGARKEIVDSPNEPATKLVENVRRPRRTKAIKDDLAAEKPKSSNISKKATKELAADKSSKAETTSKKAEAATKTKAKKSTIEKGSVDQEGSAIVPVAAVDEGPFETLLESEKGNVSEANGKPSAAGPQAAKTGRNAKKSARESKASKTESAKAPAAEIAINSVDLTKEGGETGAERAKKAVKTKSPAIEKATDVAEFVEKGVKAGLNQAEQIVKSMAPAAETPASVPEVVKKGPKSSAEKAKKGAKPKETKTSKDDGSVKLGETVGEKKQEAYKSRKRKAPASADTETLKTDILDPLSEHASATKKQKKTDNKSKSIGDTVGELLATATEGANAARASLGGLATSIMGSASEAVEGGTAAKKSAKASAQRAKGKGKAIAEDVTESLGKIAGNEGPESADLEDNSNDEPDDHTTALLAGLESDGDEVGPLLGPGFQQGQKVPPLPHAETTTKKLKDVESGANDGPGIVYVGRIPHGFYEHEMREYFTQFGDISRLRLSRNRKTGASKHYAFVEFNSAGVAKIVADTMNNYLMFGHILKCKVVPKEQVHESLWKGANKRFKAVPWNKIEGRKLEMGLGKEQWTSRIENEKKRRASKNEKTKAIGYEFEAGDLKGVDQLPVKDAGENGESGEKVEEEKSLVTAGGGEDNGAVVVVSEEVKTKRVRKVKGKTAESTTAAVKKTKRALDVGGEEVGSATKKVKKGKNAAT